MTRALPSWVSGAIAELADRLERPPEDLGPWPLGRDPLAMWLYAAWYSYEPGHSAVDEHLPLPAAYRAAHRATAIFDEGWTVVEAAGGRRRLIVERATIRREVGVLDFAPSGSIRRAEPGHLVHVTRRLDSLHGGFWHTWSEAFEANRQSPLRVYWNVGPQAAIALVRAVSEVLPDNLAWSLKVPEDAAGCNRSDAAVLYLPGAAPDQLAGLTDPVRAALGCALRQRTPALTKPLAPGIAWAEDPDNGQSFGQQRCAIVADALLEDLSVVRDRDRLCRALRGAFDRAGLDLSEPHRRAPSA